MRQDFFCFLTFALFVSCKKEHDSRIDIYLLKSFTSTVDQSTTPATISITHAVLDDSPFVRDHDIQFYTKATTTFTLSSDIQTTIQNYGSDKAFAVTLDNQPIYYGKFHPTYLNSITFGVATIAPFPPGNNELKIDFASLEGNSVLQQLDKRNDSRLINTLQTTDRLR